MACVVQPTRSTIQSISCNIVLICLCLYSNSRYTIFFTNGTLYTSSKANKILLWRIPNDHRRQIGIKESNPPCPSSFPFPRINWLGSITIALGFVYSSSQAMRDTFFPMIWKCYTVTELKYSNIVLTAISIHCII